MFKNIRDSMLLEKVMFVLLPIALPLSKNKCSHMFEVANINLKSM